MIYGISGWTMIGGEMGLVVHGRGYDFIREITFLDLK